MCILVILPEPGFLAFTTFSGLSSANDTNIDVKFEDVEVTHFPVNGKPGSGYLFHDRVEATDLWQLSVDDILFEGDHHNRSCAGRMKMGQLEEK